MDAKQFLESNNELIGTSEKGEGLGLPTSSLHHERAESGALTDIIIARGQR